MRKSVDLWWEYTDITTISTVPCHLLIPVFCILQPLTSTSPISFFIITTLCYEFIQNFAFRCVDQKQVSFLDFPSPSSFPLSSCRENKEASNCVQLLTLQLVQVRLEVLKHTEVRMIEDAVQNIPPVVVRARIEQSLRRNAVREQKNDAQQREIEQFYHLQHTVALTLSAMEHTIEKHKHELMRQLIHQHVRYRSLRQCIVLAYSVFISTPVQH